MNAAQLSPRKILLLEDDEMIASGLVWILSQEGYDVTHSKTVEHAKESISATNFDLAILDMQLPDGTGFQIQEILSGTGTAVIFLTAADDKVIVVRALESGALDYLTKPFDVRELQARIKNALASTTNASEQAMVVINDLSIDTQYGKAYINGEEIELTALEYRLLVFLATNRGRLFSRAEIMDTIWTDANGYIGDNALSVYIKKLRSKLGGQMQIETVRGHGYRVG